MNWYKYWYYTMAAGCGKKEDKKDYFVFYVNNELTKVVAKKITLQHTSSGKAQVKELLKDLQTQPEDATLRRTIPRKVKIQNIDLISYQITVDFSKEYYDMKPTEEILTRAAIAKTLLQLSQYVTFTVDGKPLVDASGANVGAMNLDSFVENPGEQINSSQKATLKLYFSNKAGTRLVPETREVHYSSNISLEKLVMEQLIEGPRKSGLLATIPSETKLITITVVDGVCYVKAVDSKGNVIAKGDNVTLAGWKNWKTPSVSFKLDKETEVTLVVGIVSAKGGWGTERTA